MSNLLDRLCALCGAVHPSDGTCIHGVKECVHCEDCQADPRFTPQPLLRKVFLDGH